MEIISLCSYPILRSFLFLLGWLILEKISFLCYLSSLVIMSTHKKERARDSSRKRAFRIKKETFDGILGMVDE